MPNPHERSDNHPVLYPVLPQTRRNLFYSPHEGIAFLVANGDIGTAAALIARLNEGLDEFLRLVPTAKREDVVTSEITKSRHYQGMRVFYAKADAAPAGAFVISSPENKLVHWTMDTWLED